MFIGREDEIWTLKTLRSLLPDSSQVVVIVGERGVGKTSLVREAFKEDWDRVLYVSMISVRTNFFPEDLKRRFEWKFKTRINGYGWEGILEGIFRHINEHGDAIIILDDAEEFAKINQRNLFVLKSVYERFSRRGLLLVFISSDGDLMAKLFERPDGPLFGIAPVFMKVVPFTFSEVLRATLEKGANFLRALQLYALFGGFPAVYRFVEEANLWSAPIEEILKRTFFSPFAPFLRGWAESLLKGIKFSSNLNWNVLKAIAVGNNTIKKIADYIGVPETSLTKPLGELIRKYDLVEKEVPVLETSESSKLGRYRVKNRVLKLWVGLNANHRDLIEFEMWDELVEVTKRWMDREIKWVLKEALIEYYKTRAPKEYESVGGWWTRKKDLLDVVAVSVSAGEIHFGKVLWKEDPDQNTLSEFIHAARKFLGGFSSWKRKLFLVVDRENLRNLSESYPVEVITLKDLESMLLLPPKTKIGGLL